MATRSLVLLALALSNLLARAAAQQVGVRRSPTSTSLSDVVCELSTLMDLGVNCDSINERLGQHVVIVAFDVDGQPAEFVFKRGCVELAEAYMKMRSILQPGYMPQTFKQRVIEFFARSDWVAPLDSAHCAVASWNIPETEHTTLMRVNCTTGLDCTTFNIFPDGMWFTEISNSEVHTKWEGREVGFMVERLSEAFNFRTASIPAGHDPVFRAVDVPGADGGITDIVNSFMPQALRKRLSYMRDLLAEGESDRDNISLWPWPPRYGQDDNVGPVRTQPSAPLFRDEPFSELAADQLPPSASGSAPLSFYDRVCSSCPAMETVCDTMSVHIDPASRNVVIKYKYEASMYHEAEIWMSSACGGLLERLAVIAHSTSSAQEFVNTVYGTPDLLREMSSGRCSIVKLELPHDYYWAHGVCKAEASADGADAATCIRFEATPDGATKLSVSNFEVGFSMFAPENHTTVTPDPAVRITFERDELHFNVKTAQMGSREGAVRVEVDADADTPVWRDHPEVRDQILAWDGKLEEVVRRILRYLSVDTTRASAHEGLAARAKLSAFEAASALGF